MSSRCRLLADGCTANLGLHPQRHKCSPASALSLLRSRPRRSRTLHHKPVQARPRRRLRVTPSPSLLQELCHYWTYLTWVQHIGYDSVQFWDAVALVETYSTTTQEKLRQLDCTRFELCSFFLSTLLTPNIIGSVSATPVCCFTTSSSLLKRPQAELVDDSGRQESRVQMATMSQEELTDLLSAQHRRGLNHDDTQPEYPVHARQHMRSEDGDQPMLASQSPASTVLRTASAVPPERTVVLRQIDESDIRPRPTAPDIKYDE